MHAPSLVGEEWISGLARPPQDRDGGARRRGGGPGGPRAERRSAAIRRLETGGGLYGSATAETW